MATESGALREALDKWDLTAFEIAWYQRLAEQPKTGVRPLRYDVKRDFHKAIFAVGFQAALSLSSPIEPPPQDPAEMREEADIHSGYATPRWLVYFDDLDRGPIAFHTEAEARKFYEDSKVAWSCHLFVLVPSRPAQASSEIREHIYDYDVESTGRSVNHSDSCWCRRSRQGALGNPDHYGVR